MSDTGLNITFQNIFDGIISNIYDMSIFAKDNSNASIFDNEDIRKIAHRGSTTDAPENTLPAFISANEKGYDTIECDVRWSKDDVPILLHDRTINRTARKNNGFLFIFSKPCNSVNSRELMNYDFGSWFDKKYKDTKIGTLEEALNYASENNLQLYIEIKDENDFDDEKAQILTKMVKDYGMKDNVSWISFNSSSLKKISEILPNARLGYLTKNKITDDTVNTLKKLKTSNNEVFLDIKYNKITEDGINKLNKNGFTFEAWTVNNIEDVEKLKDLGCSGITTDTILP